MSKHSKGTLQRYTANERSNHWITAICFVVLALSGLALFHPAFFWLTALFGGGQWTRILHPIFGLIMAASFFVMALRFWHHNILTKEDKQWLSQMEDVVAMREDRLPQVGRYNAGQKLLFQMMVLCMLGLLLSGIVIWRAYFAFYFPPGLVRAAALLHAFCAWVLIMGIVVHIYAAIWVKGSMGAMLRGTVSLGWARKHHRAWFDDMIKQRSSSSKS
jgi:formate dehydrogenase subunit gamma